MEIPEPGEVFHGDDGTTSVVLAESHDPNYEPTQEELEEYAAYIGLDLAKEPQLKWIAMEGLRAPLPSEWRACKTGDGEIYYFNFANGESMWEHPLDEKFKQKVIAERGKLSSTTSSPPTSARAKTTTTTTASAATRSETPKTSHTAESSARRTTTGTGATRAISDALLGFASEETHKGIESSSSAGPPGLLLRPGLNSNSSNGNNALTHLIPPRLETLPTASSLSGRPALPDVLTESGTHHGSPALDAVAHMTPVTNLSSGSSPAPFGALALGSPGLTPTSTTTPSSGAMMGSRDIEATIRKRVEDEYAPRRRAVRLQLDKELIAERALLAQKLSALRDELQQARQRDNTNGISSANGNGEAAQEEEQVWARRLQAAQTQHDALQSKVKEREAAVQEVRGRSLLQLEKDLATRTSEELDARRRTLQDAIDAEVKAIDTEEAAKLQALQSELDKELNEVRAAEEAATRRADERNAQQSETMLKMLREALRSQQEKLAEAKQRVQQEQEKKQEVKVDATAVSSEKDEAVVRQVEQACAEALASLEADYAQQEASLEAKIAEAKKALEANTKAKSEDTTKTANTTTTNAAADVTVDYAAKLKAEEARLNAELQRARIAYEQETNALVAKASAAVASSVATVPSQQQQQQDKPSSAVQEAEKACTQSSQIHAIRTRHVAALKQLELSHEKTMRELRQSHTQRLAQLGKFDPRTTPEYNSGLTERKRAWLAAHPAPTFTSSSPTTSTSKTSSADSKATVQVSSSSAAAAAMEEEAMDEVTVDEAEVHKAVQEKLVTLRKEMHEAQAKALDELATRQVAELASFGERYRNEQLKKARSELEQEKQRMMDTAQEEDSEEQEEEEEEEEEGSDESEEESDVTDEALAKLRESVTALKQRVAEADTTTQTTDSKTEATQQQDVVKEDVVPLEQATQEQNALRTHWQAILQALHDAIAQEMERYAQLRRTLMTSSTAQTVTETASMSAPLPLPASSIALDNNNTTTLGRTTVSNSVNGDGQAINLSVSHDKPPTAPAAWANNPRASTPPVSWTTTTTNNTTTVNSAAAAAQAMNTPIHASQRIPSHAVGEASLLASHGTQRPHTHPYSDKDYDTNSGHFATLPHFTSATPSTLPHGLVSSALRPAPHSPLASTSGFITNNATAGQRQDATLSAEQAQTQRQNEGEVNNNKKDDNVHEAVVGDVDTAMISGRRSPWYSSSVNSSVSGAAEGSTSEVSPVSLVSYGQRLAVLRDALHARRQALLACQRELQDVRAEWRRDMHACKVRHDRVQAQELRKTKEALEQYARALNEAVLRVKAASHEWRAQQARYRATLAALTAQQQQEKEGDDDANEGGVLEGSGRQMQRPVTHRSGAESQAVSSGATTTAESGGSASFMAEQLQHLVRRAAELEKMLPSARQAA